MMLIYLYSEKVCFILLKEIIASCAWRWNSIFMVLYNCQRHLVYSRLVGTMKKTGDNVFVSYKTLNPQAFLL